jgi:putative addiction module component (TIGR02574 family)
MSSIKKIEADFRALSVDEKAGLIRRLIAELDGIVESDCEEAWMDEAQRRYQEWIEGKVQALSGDEVFARLQTWR